MTVMTEINSFQNSTHYSLERFVFVLSHENVFEVRGRQLSGFTTRQFEPDRLHHPLEVFFFHQACGRVEGL